MHPSTPLRPILVSSLGIALVAVLNCGTTSGSGGSPGSGPDALPDGSIDDARGSSPDGSTATDGGAVDASLGPCTQEGTGCGPTVSGNFTGICCGQECRQLPDNDNCGGCGEKCQGATTCVGHAYGQVSCGIVVDDCTQLHEDPNASAATLVVCRIDNGYGVCCGSGCVSNAGWDSDPSNCGHCGVVCPKGAICQGGECRNTTGGCGNPATPCPDGFTCNGLECTVTACSAATTNYLCNRPTGGAGVCCGSSCVKTSTCQ